MTNICWRPLTFWDEEQIKELKKGSLTAILNKNFDFRNLKDKYYEVWKNIEELENDQENYYSKLKDIVRKECLKNSIDFPINELYLFI